MYTRWWGNLLCRSWKPPVYGTAWKVKKPHGFKHPRRLLETWNLQYISRLVYKLTHWSTWVCLWLHGWLDGVHTIALHSLWQSSLYKPCYWEKWELSPKFMCFFFFFHQDLGTAILRVKESDKQKGTQMATLPCSESWEIRGKWKAIGWNSKTCVFLIRF